MSVIMTLRVKGDPQQFQSVAKSDSERIGRILEIAKSNGLIAHRWYASDGEFMAVDEWPDTASFQAFFEAAGSEIGPLMEGAGITEQPTPSFWTKMDVGDDVGWGA